MSFDIVDLREFYVTALGQFVRRVLRQKLARFWPDVKGEDVLALGYATPLLRPWLGQAARLMAMMPGSQGVAYWPREGANVACLADLENLPLADESVSRVVVLHGLETAADPDAVLGEIWRVLKANGQALIIVPNRRGLWQLGEATPFGHGQPYSTSQLKKLLRNQGFLVEKSAHALWMPPFTSRLSLAIAGLLERIFRGCCPAFGGVLIMEASKQVFAPTLVKSRSLGRRLVLPMPFPSSPLPTNREKSGNLLGFSKEMV